MWTRQYFNCTPGVRSSSPMDAGLDVNDGIQLMLATLSTSGTPTALQGSGACLLTAVRDAESKPSLPT